MNIAGQTLPESGAVPDTARMRWLLLWDGECGFCRRSVERVLRWDRRGEIQALRYQDALDWLPEAVRERSPHQAHLRSPDGRYWGGGAAVIRLAGVLGHPLLERVLGAPGMRQAVELGYRLVARHRRRIGRWV